MRSRTTLDLEYEALHKALQSAVLTALGSLGSGATLSLDLHRRAKLYRSVAQALRGR